MKVVTMHPVAIILRIPLAKVVQHVLTQTHAVSVTQMLVVAVLHVAHVASLKLFDVNFN